MKTAIQIIDEMIEELNLEGFIPSNTDSIVTSYLREAKERIHKETGWISVEDRLPKSREDVLVWGQRRHEIDMRGGKFTLCHRLDENEIANENRSYYDINGFAHMSNVTHWMPLPLPPHE